MKQARSGPALKAAYRLPSRFAQKRLAYTATSIGPSTDSLQTRAAPAGTCLRCAPETHHNLHRLALHEFRNSTNRCEASAAVPSRPPPVRRLSCSTRAAIERTGSSRQHRSAPQITCLSDCQFRQCHICDHEPPESEQRPGSGRSIRRPRSKLSEVFLISYGFDRSI